MNSPECNHNIPDKAIAKNFASKGGKATKHYSPMEKQARADRLAKVREKRWPKKLQLTTRKGADK